MDAFRRVTGAGLDYEIGPRRAGDPPSLISDNSAIMAEFPWEPRHADLTQIVTHALAWERQLGDRA